MSAGGRPRLAAGGIGGACGADVFDGGRGGQPRHLPQLTDELPAVQRIEQVDIAGASVEDGEGESSVRIDARGRLVRVAAVFQCDFVHRERSFSLASVVLYLL